MKCLSLEDWTLRPEGDDWVLTPAGGGQFVLTADEAMDLFLRTLMEDDDGNEPDAPRLRERLRS